MSLVDRIRREHAQMKLREEQRERRYSAAREAVLVLERDHQRRIFLELYDMRGSADTPDASTAAGGEVVTTSPADDDKSKTELAEAFVMGRPDEIGRASCRERV